MKKLSFVLFLFLIISCGKKGLPTSPDRWAPKIKDIIAVDKTHINCYFSEKILATSISSNNIFNIINSVTSDSLEVITAILSEDKQILHLTTFPQDSVNYFFYCDSITDLAGNIIKPQTLNFIGSLQNDTSAPEIINIIPKESSFVNISETLFTVIFSEPMDTLEISNNFFILPENDFNVKCEFNSTFTEFYFLISDNEDTTFSSNIYYIYLTKFCDISGNYINISTYTTLPFFTLYNQESEIINNIAINLSDTIFNSYSMLFNKNDKLVNISSINKVRSVFNAVEVGNYKIIIVENTDSGFYQVANDNLYFELVEIQEDIIINIEPAESLETETLNFLKLILP